MKIHSPPFAVGDHVIFAKNIAHGRGVQMMEREGRIVRFSTPAGTFAEVRYHGDRFTWVPLKDIRLDDNAPSRVYERILTAESKVHLTAAKLILTKDPMTKLAMLWHLAWDSELRDLEDFRPAGGFKDTNRCSSDL